MAIQTPSYALMPREQRPGFLSGILEGYKSGTKMQREGMLAERQGKLADIQARTAEQKLEALPEQQRIALQQARTTIGTEQLRQKELTDKLEKTGLENKVMRAGIVNKVLGGVKDQNTYEAAQRMLQDYGIMSPQQRLPARFEEALPRIEMAREQSGKELEQAKLRLEELKVVTPLKVAQIKLKLDKTDEYAKNLKKQEAESDVKFKNETLASSEKAKALLGTIGNIRSSLEGAYTGFVGTGLNWDSESGQLLKKYMNEFVLDRIGDLKNVSRTTNYLAGLIKASKPSDWMKRGAIESILNRFGAAQQRAVQKENFREFMWENGITDRGKINKIFDKYDKNYPIIDIKSGTFMPENINKWQQFLVENPNIGGKTLSGLEKPLDARTKMHSLEDLEYTAKKHNISVDEVKRRLGNE